MADYLNVYDLNRQKSAVLQNAFEITETQELNKIYTLDFKIPANDPKVQYLQPFHYARYGESGELYRIIKTELEDSDTPILSVNCEHVIATLVDDLMFGAYQYGGGTVKTADVIRWLLSKQKTANWALAECDFIHRYEYNWEQENILNALYSIPKEFTKAYKWVFDTTGYPWRLSLKAIDATIHPEFYIRAKRNLLSSGTAQDFAGICTRIYPLGYGEGVNQLTIKDATVTNIKKSGNVNINADIDNSSSTKYGNTYIQSDAAIVAQYGIKEKVLVDRRFEDVNSLFSYGKTMLEGLQTPSMSRSFDVVDLYPLTSKDIDRAEVGKICKMTGDDTIAYITKTVRVLDEAGNLQIDLSTKATDVVSAIADLADRVRIESVYAQGATQLYQHSKDANATPTKGMVMSLYFPEEMRQINKVLMRLKLGSFRSYSKASSGDGGRIDLNTGDNGAINTNTGDSGAINTNTGDNGAINTNTGDGGAINTNTEDSGSIDQNTGDNGAINQDTESGGAINTETGSAGGGSGTTGTASVGSATISGSITTESKWEDSNGLYVTTTGTSQKVSGFDTGDGKKNSTWDEVETQSASGTATLAGHVHKIWGLMPHKHAISDFNINIPALNLNLWQLRHTHDIKIKSDANFGSHSHTFSTDAHSHSIQVGPHSHSIKVDGHSHSIEVDGHSHSIQVGPHSHSIQVGPHSHSIKVDAHHHSIKVDPHSHAIEAGIFESGNPSSFQIYVSGKYKTTINSTSYNNDITSWLLNDKNQIPRNSWIDIEIRPNDLAYVQSSVFVQGFVQSRGGGNY